MPIDPRAANDINIDLENRLFNFLQKKQAIELLMSLLKQKNQKDLISLLCNGSFIPRETLFATIEKYDKALIHKLFDEPDSESDMAVPIFRRLKEEGYFVSQEVPLPKTGKSRARKMDLAGYKLEKKKGLFGGTNIVVMGYELKSEGTRGAIDKAFSQANDYLSACEAARVCFSPLLYAKYYDVIHEKAKDYNVGVQVVGKSAIYFEVKATPYNKEVPDNIQQQMVEYIKGGKGFQ